MPVHKVKLPDGTTGYQWGRTGKIYKDPRKAYAQGAAIEHSGWKEKKAQDYTQHGFFYAYRNPRPSASKEQVQKLKEILGVYPSVHRIAGYWSGQDAQPNAYYVGTSWCHQPASIKAGAQRGYTLQDYEAYDKLPQQHARQHGIIIHTDDQDSLGTMAHELGHAKDRQMQPFLYGLRPSPAYKYTNLAIGLGIIAAGLGMFGSSISKHLADSPKLRKALLVGGGAAAAGSYAWQQLAPWLGAWLSRARQRRASLHGLYALKKMGLTAQQLQQQLKDRNAMLQTYGASPVTLDQVDTFTKNRLKYAFDW